MMIDLNILVGNLRVDIFILDYQFHIDKIVYYFRGIKNKKTPTDFLFFLICPSFI